jgi:hypothetical protein
MIYFECYSDEAFLRGLEIPSKRMEHAFSKGNVCNKLQRDTHSVGIVDEDPNDAQPHLIQSLFQSQKVTFKNQDLILAYDNRTDNKLILIRPNIEKWAIKIAHQLKINLNAKPYLLSDVENELHGLLGFAKNKRKLESFTDFFKDASSHPSIIKIREILN